MSGRSLQNRKKSTLQEGILKNDTGIRSSKNVEQNREKVGKNTNNHTVVETKVEKQERLVKQLIIEVLAEAGPSRPNKSTYTFTTLAAKDTSVFSYLEDKPIYAFQAPYHIKDQVFGDITRRHRGGNNQEASKRFYWDDKIKKWVLKENYLNYKLPDTIENE